MSEPERLDALVLGSGQGGKLLAWHMARAGRRTAVVERRYIGGSCPNIACMPSKNEVWSARVAHFVRHAAEFGTIARRGRRHRDRYGEGSPAQARDGRARGRPTPEGTTGRAAPKLSWEAGASSGRRHSRCSSTTAAAACSWPNRCSSISDRMPPCRPYPAWKRLDRSRISRRLSWMPCPAHLIVLGGGYVGLEMAQAFRRFGSEVTVIEAGSQLMSREDPDVAATMQRILSEEGVRLLLSADTLNVNGRSGGEVTMTVRTPIGRGEDPRKRHPCRCRARPQYGRHRA